MALRLAGIELVDRHREILYRRSARLGILDGNGLDALLRAAEDGDPGARQRLVGLFTTNLTGFFRHPAHFDVAEAKAQHLVERLAARLSGYLVPKLVREVPGAAYKVPSVITP